MHRIELKILKSGLFTTIQDVGRKGSQHAGVPVSGPLDRSSAAIANKLMHQVPGSPLLEITMTGPEILFSNNCHIALAGANISPTINGSYISMYKKISVSEGDIFKFGRLLKGCRAYLSVSGNWQLKQWMNSCCPIPEANILNDHILKSGDVISIIDDYFERDTPSNAKLHLSDSGSKVKIFKGPEWNRFTTSQQAFLTGEKFTVSNQFNRMGCRLTEKLPEDQSADELISSGVVPGTIQITNDGSPIILLADAQTTGGYPRIATVSVKDLDIIGQKKPGDIIEFELFDNQ